jgi:SHS2 domain-containing protein
MAAMDAPSGYAQLDHPADLALRLWAPTEAELLRTGARALIDVLCAGRRPAPIESKALELEAIDAEDRLVRFMNEVLFLATSAGFLVADATIELVERGLRAALRGEPNGWEALGCEVKSVTYHAVRIERQPGKVVATVLLDV